MTYSVCKAITLSLVSGSKGQSSMSQDNQICQKVGRSLQSLTTRIKLYCLVFVLTCSREIVAIYVSTVVIKCVIFMLFTIYHQAVSVCTLF